MTRYEDPGNPAVGDAAYTDAAVVSFGDGLPNDLSHSEGGHVEMASLGTNGSDGGGVGLGAVYGLAYSSGTNPASPLYQNRRVYASAFAKRITRFGSGGPGAIYLVDRISLNESLYLQIPQVVPGPSGAPGNPGDGSATTFRNGNTLATYIPELGGIHRVQADTDLMNLAGKVSIGDIDLDPQEHYLYGVNLLNRQVFQIDTWSANPLASLSYLPLHPIFSNPGACNMSGMSGPQDLRPFGLAVTDDSLYLGYVCSGESSQNVDDLYAGVMRYDLIARSWIGPRAVSLHLVDYAPQRMWTAPVASNASRWQPWRASDTGSASPLGPEFRIEPQPILSDIAFDEQGNMLLGMRDRFGDIGLTPLTASNGAPMTQGDILLATRTGAYSWALPNSIAEHFNDNSTFERMPEEAGGALAYLPGTHAGSYGGEVISTMMDPYSANSAGIGWFDTNTGSRTSSEELYSNFINTTRFAKASGLGDVLLVCTWRAIGDRIWRDTNGNGRQDAGESDLAGVRLNLRDGANTLLAQVTTGSLAGMSGNFRFYVDPYQAYTIEIDPANYAPGGALAGLAPTAINVGTDDGDSDANSSGRITVAPAGSGNVDVSFDAGLSSGANVSITKTGPASAALGNTFAYTLTYANHGPGSAANLQVVDTLPGGISFFSSIPAPTSSTGQTVTWDVGTLAANGSGSIIVNVLVQPTAPASVVNTATVSTSTSGDDPADNQSSVSTTITRPEVQITKTGPASVAVDTTLTYQLVARNTGSSSAANVQVVDTLPTGLSYISANPAPASVNGQVLSWNAGTLTNGSSASYTVQARATTSAANSVINTATISTNSPGDNPNDNSSSVTTSIQRPNISISKQAAASVTAGETLQYTLRYTNTGTSLANSVVVRDTLPAGLTFSTSQPAPTQINGQDLTWNLGSVAAGASGSITLDASSQASLANASVLTNAASITTTSGGDDPNDNTAQTTTIVQRADLYVTKSSTTSFPVVSGQPVTYQIDYGNSGPASARGVQLIDSLPSQLQSVTWNCVAGCSASGTGSLSLNLGDLLAGTTGRISVRGIAATSSAREDFSNTASITTSTPEISSANNTSSVPGAVWTTDLQLVKLASPQVLAGTTFTTTLSYRNNGPAMATGVTISDTLPPGVTLVRANPPPASQSGQSLTWNSGDLADSATGSIVLTLASAADLADGSSLTNSAVVATTSPDRTASNNTATATTSVLARADMRVQKDGPASLNLGRQLTYTLTYSNLGPSLARSVVLTDTLPTELSLVSASPAATLTQAGLLVWNLGDIVANSSGTLTVVMQSGTSQPGVSLPVTNRAWIASTTSDPEPVNNSSSVTTNIVRPELTLAKTGPAVAEDGQTVRYTLSYENRGMAAAQATQIEDSLPAGVRYLSATPAPTTINGQTLTWEIGDLPASGSGIITVVVQLEPAAPATLVNQASIRTATPGDEPANNTATTTTVIQRADLSVTKQGPARAIVGTTISYTITYQVRGTTLAANVLLTDTLPTGLSFVSASLPPTSANGQQINWDLGNLNVGSDGSILVQARVDPASAQQIINTVQIQTSSPGDDPTNNTSSATTITQRPNVRVVKTGPAVVRADEEFVYTLEYANTGDAPALAVILTDLLPTGISFVSATPAPSMINGATIEWNLATLAPAASGTIMLRVRAGTAPPGDGTAIAQLVNTATLQTPSPGNDPGDDMSSVTTAVQWPDLAVYKTNDQAVVQPGDLVLYTITVTNTGRVDATGVFLTETPPPGSVVRSSQWLAQADGSYRLPIGRLASGATATRSIALQLPIPLLNNQITNTVRVSSDLPDDPTPADTSSIDMDRVVALQLGDRVWRDDNGNQQQDASEPGLVGVRVMLLDPLTRGLLATQTTNLDGRYLFSGLRAGTYVVQLDPQALVTGSVASYQASTATLLTRTLTSSEDMSADIGLRQPPTTDVTLSTFSAMPSSTGLVVRWTTTREHNTAAFRLLRGNTPNQAEAHEIAVLASQSSTGGQYAYTDNELPADGAYYWLIEREHDGHERILVAWAQPGQSSGKHTLFIPIVWR